MPRLIGRQSNVGSYVVSLLILVVIVGGLLQYYNVIDLPGIGKKIREGLKESDRSNQSLQADSDFVYKQIE